MQKYFELNNRLNIPLNGSIQLNKDHEAANVYVKEVINKQTTYFHDLDEQLRTLVDEEYIDASVITEKYSKEFIAKVFALIYSKKIRFKSFMAPYKFYTQYAMKDNDGKSYHERYEDRLAFNALTMGDGDEEIAMSLAEELSERRYQPATPTFLSAGRKHRGELVSCFLIQMEDDMNSIARGITSSLQLSRIGGGVGINLSNLREAGAPIKRRKGAASGVVPVMKVLEDVFKYSNQGGQRQGAGAVYLNVFHMDIIDFLSTRVENAEEGKRIKSLSLGLVVPDKYYELVEAGETLYMFSAYDASNYYGKPFSFIDISKEYDNMVENPKIGKKAMRAADLDILISKLQQESGYPYIMNEDTVNNANPIDGKIIMSNLCSEILQVHVPSELNDMQIYDKLGKDVSCNLGSINIPNFMKNENGKNVAKSVETMIRALTYVSDESNVETVPTINKGNHEAHAVGLGAMGLHQMLATNFIQYGSPESIEFTDKFFEMINFYTLVASNKIARERQDTFVGFENSTYASGEYFDKYTDVDEDATHFEFPRVKELFFGFKLPTKEMWADLKADVMKYGIYNQNRIAVAPNGSISYVNETTASIHPITALVEGRQEQKIGKVYYPAPGLNNDNISYYKTAYEMSMLKMIDVYAAAQKHVDQGMSLTLFFNSQIPAGLYPWKMEGGPMTTKDLTLVRHYAWKKGIKTIYYVRTFTEDEDGDGGIAECESCMV